MSYPYLTELQTLKEALIKTFKKEGVSGLYSGLSSSLFGIAVTNGVYYAFCRYQPHLFYVASKANDIQMKKLDRSYFVVEPREQLCRVR